MDKEAYIFGEGIFSKISEILEKNGIEETVEEAAEKEISFIDIVFRLTKDMALQNTSEEDAVSSTKKQLNVSDAVAKNIVKNIKDKILPFAEKVKIGESLLEERPNVFTEIKPPIGIPEIGETMPPVTTPVPSKKKENFTSKKSEKIEKKERIITPEKPKAPPKIQQDTYREPIE